MYKHLVIMPFSSVVLQRGQYGEVGMFASTLCKYDLMKGDLFVLSSIRATTTEK